MNFESSPAIQSPLENAHQKANDMVHEFIGNHETSLSQETLSALPAITRTIQENLRETWNNTPEHRHVRYDKYKKSFLVGNQHVTAGEIIASRHWKETFAFPEQLDTSLAGKKLRNHALTYHTLDRVTTIINHEMAEHLEKTYADKDMMKSQAFGKIKERSQEGFHSEQLGVFAESIIQGTLERIAIDCEDMGLEIIPANAGQDVLEKIDFIISTKQKRRGVGVETADPLYDEKHIGVQFTTNTSKSEFKKDQIEKSKLRGTQMDDIIYVALDHKTLAKAVEQWKKAGEPISGPWAYLNPHTRQAVLTNLLQGIITEEQLTRIKKQA